MCNFELSPELFHQHRLAMIALPERDGELRVAAADGQDDAAYGLVISWAYAGIAVKESATPLVPIVALAGAVVVLLLVGATVLARRRPAAHAMVGVAATAA